MPDRHCCKYIHTVVMVLARVNLLHELGKVPVMLLLPTSSSLSCNAGKTASCEHVLVHIKAGGFMHMLIQKDSCSAHVIKIVAVHMSSLQINQEHAWYMGAHMCI